MANYTVGYLNRLPERIDTVKGWAYLYIIKRKFNNEDEWQAWYRMSDNDRLFLCSGPTCELAVRTLYISLLEFGCITNNKIKRQKTC